MFKLANDIRSMLELCEVVKPGDCVLVIADNEGRSMWLGQLTMNVVNSMGNEAIMTVINPPEMKSQEPPACVAVAMRNVDSIIRVTDGEAPLVHTSARKEATAAGAKYFVWLMNEMAHGVSAEDVRLIKNRTEALAQRLEQTKVARVMSPAGTDITVTLTGRPSLALHCQGPVGGVPYYAEAAIAPVEGTAEGIIVVDVAFVDWNYLLREPMRLTVKQGRVVDVSGGKQDGEKIKQIIAEYENADNIAELGIGTSHIVPMPIYGTRRDVARLGTAHFALGRNNDFGGQTQSDIHLDVLMDQVTVELDGRPVVKDCALLI